MSSELAKKSLAELTPEEWARILASVGTRRKERPVDPVTVAQVFSNTPWSNEEIAHRLSVTPRTVVMFKHLLRLPEKEQELVRIRKISIDEGDRLSSLKDAAARELLIQAILNRALSADIVNQVIRFKRPNPGMPIEDCINEVVKSKPKTRHWFAARIGTNIDKALIEKAQRNAIASSELLKDILEKSFSIQGSVLSITLGSGVSILVLTPKGWEALRKKSGELGVPLDDAVEEIARLWLEANP